MQKLVVRLSIALIFGVLGMQTTLAGATQSSEENSSNRFCFQNFRACRQGCITQDTRYFMGGVIDWDTNICLLDCDLAVLGCIATTIAPILED